MLNLLMNLSIHLPIFQFLKFEMKQEIEKFVNIINKIVSLLTKFSINLQISQFLKFETKQVFA